MSVNVDHWLLLVFILGEEIRGLLARHRVRVWLLFLERVDLVLLALAGCRPLRSVVFLLPLILHVVDAVEACTSRGFHRLVMPDSHVAIVATGVPGISSRPDVAVRSVPLLRKWVLKLCRGLRIFVHLHLVEVGRQICGLDRRFTDAK